VTDGAPEVHNQSPATRPGFNRLALFIEIEVVEQVMHFDMFVGIVYSMI
jgi:hypothetical protein